MKFFGQIVSSGQTVEIERQPDQCLNYLPFGLHFLEALLFGKTVLSLNFVQLLRYTGIEAFSQVSEILWFFQYLKLKHFSQPFSYQYMDKDDLQKIKGFNIYIYCASPLINCRTVTQFITSWIAHFFKTDRSPCYM